MLFDNYFKFLFLYNLEVVKTENSPDDDGSSDEDGDLGDLFAM